MYLLGAGMNVAHAHAGHATAGADWPPEWLMNLHLAGALLIAAFMIAHLAMLITHELKETRALASSMISGNKFFTDEEYRQIKGESHE